MGKGSLREHLMMERMLDRREAMVKLLDHYNSQKELTKIKSKHSIRMASYHSPSQKKTNVEGKPTVKRIDISSTKPDIAIPSTVASAIVSKDEVTTSRASIATDSERSSELLITEDDKLPTDGPAQDMTNEPTLVHSSYA